jgi:hypothetical protein
MTGGDVRYLINTESGRKTGSFLTVLLSGLLLLTSFNGSAQEKYDPGIFAGTSYYMGDLNPSVHYAAPSIAVGPILRYNFNFHNSIRAHAIYHKLRGNSETYSGPVFPGDQVFNGISGGNFDANFVDLGLDFEFNWRPYRTAFRKTKESPYVFAGIGYGINLALPAGNIGQLTVPFGFGYKINVGRWLSAGAEMSARKTFTDAVDYDAETGKYYGNPQVDDVVAFFGNNDWYFFTGVFVTYKIFKFWEDCPAYDDQDRR